MALYLLVKLQYYAVYMNIILLKTLKILYLKKKKLSILMRCCPIFFADDDLVKQFKKMVLDFWAW